MLLSALQSKDIINLNDGKKMGNIIDVSINQEGVITELSVQKRKFLFFYSATTTIKWKQIDKIGKDVILVNINS